MEKIDKEKEILKIENEYLNNLFSCDLKLQKTISLNEERMLHFNFKQKYYEKDTYK